MQDKRAGAYEGPDSTSALMATTCLREADSKNCSVHDGRFDDVDMQFGIAKARECDIGKTIRTNRQWGILTMADRIKRYFEKVSKVKADRQAATLGEASRKMMLDHIERGKAELGAKIARGADGRPEAKPLQSCRLGLAERRCSIHGGRFYADIAGGLMDTCDVARAIIFGRTKRALELADNIRAFQARQDLAERYKKGLYVDEVQMPATHFQKYDPKAGCLTITSSPQSQSICRFHGGTFVSTFRCTNAPVVDGIIDTTGVPVKPIGRRPVGELNIEVTRIDGTTGVRSLQGSTKVQIKYAAPWDKENVQIIRTSLNDLEAIRDGITYLLDERFSKVSNVG